MPLIRHYNNCKSRGLVNHGENRFSNDLAREIEKPARLLLKNFVIKNDIDGFIRSCIEKNRYDNYQLDSNFLFEVMGSRKEAEEFFANPKVKSIFREEFSNLIELSFTVGKHREEGFPKDYFKVIPVEKPFSED